MKSEILKFAAAFLLALALASGYSLLHSAVVNESEHVDELQSQIFARTEAAKNISSERAALAQISSGENEIQNYFVPEAGIVDFIDELETEGKLLKAAVDVLSVSSNDSSSKNQPAFSLTLAISGTFDSVMRTIGAIEYSPHEISVSELSLTKEDKNIWSANVGILVDSAKAATSTAPKSETP